MHYIISFFLALLLLTASWPVDADESTPLLFSRSRIAIIRAVAAEDQSTNALPWQEEIPFDPRIVLDVEVRDAMSLYRQRGWINVAKPAEQTGLMMVFSAQTVAPVTRSEQYAPLDILMIDSEGKIIQILPNLSLADLEDDVYPSDPILALLFLKGGTCETLSIKPGDHVEYKIFKKPPVVLTAPGAASMNPKTKTKLPTKLEPMPMAKPKPTPKGTPNNQNSAGGTRPGAAVPVPAEKPSTNTNAVTNSSPGKAARYEPVDVDPLDILPPIPPKEPQNDTERIENILNRTDKP